MAIWRERRSGAPAPAIRAALRVQKRDGRHARFRHDVWWPTLGETGLVVWDCSGAPSTALAAPASAAYLCARRPTPCRGPHRPDGLVSGGYVFSTPPSAFSRRFCLIIALVLGPAVAALWRPWPGPSASRCRGSAEGAASQVRRARGQCRCCPHAAGALPRGSARRGGSAASRRGVPRLCRPRRPLPLGGSSGPRRPAGRYSAPGLVRYLTGSATCVNPWLDDLHQPHPRGRSRASLVGDERRRARAASAWCSEWECPRDPTSSRLPTPRRQVLLGPSGASPARPSSYRDDDLIAEARDTLWTTSASTAPASTRPAPSGRSFGERRGSRSSRPTTPRSNASHGVERHGCSSTLPCRARARRSGPSHRQSLFVVDAYGGSVVTEGAGRPGRRAGTPSRRLVQRLEEGEAPELEEVHSLRSPSPRPRPRATWPPSRGLVPS